MKHFGRSRYAVTLTAGPILLLGLITGIGLAQSSEPEASPPEGIGPSCWQEVDVPSAPTRGRFMDVLASPTEAWILGLALPPDTAQPIALQRLEGGWSRRPVPWDTAGGLMGGDIEPGVATWVVGFTRPDSDIDDIVHMDAPAHAIAARWEGDQWVDAGAPAIAGDGDTLTDAEVLPSGEMWAVGTRFQSGRTFPLVLQWVEGTWTRHEPTLQSSDAGLTAVTASPDGVVWSVGWHSVRGLVQPLLLRLDGQRWTIQRLGSAPTGQTVLTDIAFRASDDGYLVGYAVPEDGIEHVPLLYHWDGAAWVPVDLPWAADRTAVLRSIAIGDGDALLLTGARVAVDAGWTRAFHARFLGGRWEVRRADVNAYQNSELVAGSFESGTPIVVGSHAARTMAFAACPHLTGSQGRQDRPDPEAEGVGPPMLRPDASHAPRVDDRVAHVRFEDVAPRMGIAEETESYGGVAADFDGDGWTDIFYSRHTAEVPRLLRGTPDGLRDVPDTPFRDRDRHGCAVGDVDADGWPDLYCAHGAAYGSAMTSKELWLHPGRNPRQVTAEFGVVDPFGRGRRATFFRLGVDPYPELYVTNDPERVDGLPSLNRLYHNDGGDRFLAGSRAGLDVSMGGRCVTAGDLEADGDDDLLVCATEPWDGLPAGLRVFRNDRSSLVHATRDLGLAPIGDEDVVVADFDGDGQADDVAQLGSRSLLVSLGRGDRVERVFETTVTDGRAIAAGDVDADGMADLYVVQGGAANEPDLMLINTARGRDFREATIPQVTGGSGDDAITLDHDRNGLSDFLVLNGRGPAGPIQLIASFLDPP